jgi:hypothetical protein
MKGNLLKSIVQCYLCGQPAKAVDALELSRYNSLAVEFFPIALIVVGGVLVLILILKFIGGCLLRIILIAAMIALAIFLVYQFVWS